MPPEAQTAFFSYCREDSEFALKLAEDLKAAGAHVWIDQRDIEPGTPWPRAVEEALEGSPRMVVLLSPAAVSSNNVLNEISRALRKGKKVLPALFFDCEIPLQLELIQYIDFRTDYAHGLKSLLGALGVAQPMTSHVDAASASARPDSGAFVTDEARSQDARVSLITAKQLVELEKLREDGGELLEDGVVVVASAEPPECANSTFSATVMNNLKRGVRYEYYWHNIEHNIVGAASLVLNIATAELALAHAPIEKNLELVRHNLGVMQSNLSIHFTKRVSRQSYVLNATSEEHAVGYLRWASDPSGRFVEWARRRAAVEMARELSESCNTPKRGASIFHSTSDFALAEYRSSTNDAANTRIRWAIKKAFPEGLSPDFYMELNQRCLGA